MVHQSLHDGPHDGPRGRRYPLWLTFALVLLALVAVALLARYMAASGARKNARNGRPPAPVAVAKVGTADMPVLVSAIGTVTPIDVATVRAQLAGTIFALNFKEGQHVAAGQVIAQIDPRPFRLTLQTASANLARDAAQLAAAQVDLRRYQTLLSQDSIARQQVDTQAATVRQLAGTIAADRAAIGSARLNLNYSAVKSPITGTIGLRQVTVGNYVTPGDAGGIAVVTRTDPIDVAFAIPQSQLAQVRHAAGAASAGSGGALPVTALDQDNVNVLARGSFATFDNQIDTATGTIKAKARFANPGNVASQALFPNQFVNVRLLVDTLRQVPVVPVSALRHGTPGDFVFVLQPDQTVKLTVVRPGPGDGTNIAVLSGLAKGATVVTEGADGLDDGSKVRLPGGGGGGGFGKGAPGAPGAAGAHAHGGHHRPPAA